MLKRAALSVLLLLTACATPAVELTPTYRLGSTRVYHLESTATTTTDLGGEETREETVLKGRSTVQVSSTDGDRTTLRVTLAPEGFRRGGREVALPGEQAVELIVGPDGAVTEILTIGGVPADLIAGDIGNLAPALGVPLPGEQLHLGDRWTTELPAPAIRPAEGEPAPPALPPGNQQGKLAALRVVRDYDCAVLEVSTRRLLVAERAVGGQPVRLVGAETSASRIAFAFREGFPVEIETDAEGRFQVGSGSFTGGNVTIVSHVVLTLLEPQASG